ncbi:hypothetical protein ABAC460_01295 [Asticcacaulis sp. AC460]|uniref:erythromycin esterase family protein n=1 Tax=Asticcacaulis sp. AC460 TaxID=1282360 RepID=UPI0003C3F2AF|nr:erythromycin esterase family protein [Asticcacaulis sp. AC460]ESQ92910.1 hypothetical protein ABAC460_01295 [Asticcacaulis sp. AC460]
MKLWRGLALALTFAASPAWTQTAASPLADAEATAIAWINAEGHPLSGADASPAELAPLAARLAGGRVIGIGEVTHGDHESQHFKAGLIEELVRQGAIDAVAIEANRDVARTFDLYIREGQGDPMALMRSTSFFRVFRNEEFAGLLVWLRAWNQVAAKPVRIFGIDDQDAGRDADFALKFVARYDKALAKKLRAPFGSLIAGKDGIWPKSFTWIGAMTPDEIAVVKANARLLADTIAAHEADWGKDPDYAEAAYAAEVAWQNIHIFELDGKGTERLRDRPAGYFERRDIFMAKNLLGRLGAGEQAALWAHNSHIAAGLPQAYIDQSGTTLGHELKQALGDGYHTLGFVYSTGDIMVVVGDMNKLSSLAQEEVYTALNNRPGELGYVFGQASSDALWIDMTQRPASPLMDAWVKTAYWDGSAGWGVDPNDWQKGPIPVEYAPPQLDTAFDVMVWFRQLTPSRRLPVAP